jgi:hypothetical protein
VASRHEIIAAADLPGRLAVLDGWYGDTVGISKTYAIGYDDAVGEIGHAAVELDHRSNLWARRTSRAPSRHVSPSPLHRQQRRRSPRHHRQRRRGVAQT